MKFQVDDASSLAQQLTQMQSELTELAKASEALQETVDALATMTGLDQFIPVVLRIAARVFASAACVNGAFVCEVTLRGYTATITTIAIRERAKCLW